MTNIFITFSPAILCLTLAGCGTGVSQLTEAWDRDPNATQAMEKQIKRAIFCQLRTAAKLAASVDTTKNYYGGKNVTGPADEFGDTWGIQTTITLTADEKTAFTPNISFKDPLEPVKSFGQNVSQSFSAGFSGALSSQNVRYDKYSFYYTVHDLINDKGEEDICVHPPGNLGPPSTSSPFVDASNLGIGEWLPAAVSVSMFQRSSRIAPNGEGPALGTSGTFSPDSATYDNKFVIISDGNATPTWNLLRVGTSGTSLIDFNRTRTHELLITIAQSQTALVEDPKTHKKRLVSTGTPSQAAVDSHFASEIGSAISAAIH